MQRIELLLALGGGGADEVDDGRGAVNCALNGRCFVDATGDMLRLGRGTVIALRAPRNDPHPCAASDEPLHETPANETVASDDGDPQIHVLRRFNLGNGHYDLPARRPRLTNNIMPELGTGVRRPAMIARR